MKTYFFSKLYIFFILLPYIIPIEEYTIYDASAKYPRPLLLSTNEVLALSGEPGTLTILNSKGEIIQQKQSLPFTYTSNACVRELKNGKYVVSSGGGDINLIVFDNNLHYYSTLTGKKSNGFFINITPLLDGNILMNFIFNNVIYITKWILNSSTLTFSESSLSYSTQTSNKYITCIELPNSNNVLCSYVVGQCVDTLLHLSNSLSFKSVTTIWEKDGCAFDKVINMQENTFVICYFKNDIDRLKCSFGEETTSGIIVINVWHGIDATGCLADAQKLDLAYFKENVFVVTCQEKANSKNIKVMTGTITKSGSTYSMSYTSVTISSSQNVEYPFVTKFSNDFLSVFYHRGDDNVYQIPGFPNCVDVSLSSIYINSYSTIFSLNGKVINGAGDASTLYVQFVSLPTNGKLFLDDKSTLVDLTTKYSASSKSFIYQSNSIDGDIVIKFAGINSSGEGKHCSITIKVNPCYTGCKTCTSLGNESSNQCNGCLDDYYPKEDQTNSCAKDPSGYVLVGTVYKKCFNSCKECSSEGDENENHCTSCNEDYYKLYDKQTQCVDKTSSPEGYYIGTDTTTNEVMFLKCYQNCKTCSQGESSSAQNCINCIDNYYFVQGTSNCYQNAPEGYYKTSTDPIQFEECYETCKSCDSKGNSANQMCTSCKDTYSNQIGSNCSNRCTNYSQGDQCVNSCSVGYIEDAINKICINCKDTLKYNYNNQCISENNKPSHTYIDDPNTYLLKDCDEKCATCNEAIKCLSCKDNKYVLDGECVSSCGNNYYQDEIEKKCINCASIGYYKKENENECIDSIPEHYYIDQSGFNIVKECKTECLTCSDGDTCDDCISDYFFKDNQCLTCGTSLSYNSLLNQCDNCKLSTPSSYKFLNINECIYPQPTNTYIIDPTYNTIANCYSSCNSCSQSGDDTNNNCNSCKGGMFLLGSNCVASCGSLLEENGQCINAEGCKATITNKQYSDTLTELKNDIDNLVLDFIATASSDRNVNIINANDAIVRIFKSDSCSYEISNEYGYVYANFTEIEKKLKELSQYSNTEFIFVLVDIEREEATTNQLDYRVYDQYGNEINLSVLNLTINVSYPLSISNEYISLALNLSLQGFDIFDPHDDFYNDFCTPYYTEDGKDVILIDRRETYFKNISLCEEGCEYSSVDFKSARVNCECSPKSSFLDSISEKIPEDSFFNDVSLSNLIVVRCYNLVFNWKYAKNNLGHWILIILFILQIPTLLIFIFIGLKQVYAYLNQYTPKESIVIKSNPNRKSNYIIDDKTSVEDSPANLITINKTSKAPPPFDLKSQANRIDSISNINNETDVRLYKKATHLTTNQMIKEEEDDFDDDELDELVYDDALKYDKRSCCKVLGRIMMKKLVALSPCSDNSVFEPLSVKLTAFILNLGFYFGLNCALYSEKYISERFKTNDETDLIYILKNEIEKCIYVSLACSVISLLLDYIISGKKRFMTLIKKKKYTQRYLIDSKKCLSQFKTKLFWFFAICFLLFGFFWYYVSAFCAVYQKSQTSWFECSVISFVFCLVIQSFYSFVILTLRLIGLKCHCSCIYTISKYLI